MNIHSIILEVSKAEDIPTIESFYREALGLGDRVVVRHTGQPSSGFRGFAPSLILTQPGDVDAVFTRALASGAQTLKPVAKSLWGYGGSLLTPDCTAWQIASANKTATGPATGEIEHLVLLLGVDKVKTSKRFYQERGLTVARSFPAYVEFATGAIKLALYKRGGLAKQVGIDPAGSGAHNLVVAADAAFTDLDGYEWITVDTPNSEREA